MWILLIGSVDWCCAVCVLVWRCKPLESGRRLAHWHNKGGHWWRALLVQALHMYTQLPRPTASTFCVDQSTWYGDEEFSAEEGNENATLHSFQLPPACRGIGRRTRAARAFYEIGFIAAASRPPSPRGVSGAGCRGAEGTHEIQIEVVLQLRRVEHLGPRGDRIEQ